ncbi:MAG TPA: sugar ABC transporter permease [Propionibacteriaceae bacterium]|nr:sugar ABC transporter permease [Propionibacteriaceae bacterium]HVD80510.1 sugar ABC transporter permease [Propionibacteriaceae bacterium]
MSTAVTETTSTPTGTTKPKKRRTLTQRDARLGLWLMSPTLLIVVAIVIFPLLWSILLSFQRMRLIQIGRASFFEPLTLANYQRVLGSSTFWTSLLTTFAYTFGSVVLAISLGVLAAMAVRQPFRGRTFVRAAYLLPYVAPVVAVTFIWRTMLNPQFGIVNIIGQNVLGWDEPIPFVSQAVGTWNLFGLEIPVPTALLTTIAFEGWRYFPFAFLFLIARLGAMSGEAEEAALVDGATPWQSFRFIVFPQLVPIIGLLAILRTIWTFNEFDDIFLLTGGAAGTGVASIQVYNYLTVQRNVGAAAAQSVIMALVLIVLLGIYVLVLRRRGERI